MFGLISMIGGKLDMNFQYANVSEKLSAYKYEQLPTNMNIKAPIMECCAQDEDNSDFEDETPLWHPGDD